MGGGCQTSPIYACIALGGPQASSESLGSQHLEWISQPAQTGYTHGWKDTDYLMVNVSERNGFLSSILLLPYLLAKKITLSNLNTSSLLDSAATVARHWENHILCVQGHSRPCTIPGCLSHSSPSGVPSLPLSRFQGSLVCMSTRTRALQAALSFWFPLSSRAHHGSQP